MGTVVRVDRPTHLAVRPLPCLGRHVFDMSSKRAITTKKSQTKKRAKRKKKEPNEKKKSQTKKRAKQKKEP